VKSTDFSFQPHPKKSLPQISAVQLPVGGVGAAGLLVAAGALVSVPFPGLVISGAGGGGGVMEGAGGAVAGGGISGSVAAAGVLVLLPPGDGGGVAGAPLLAPDWLSVACLSHPVTANMASSGMMVRFFMIGSFSWVL
jgi:hypothetical protein